MCVYACVFRRNSLFLSKELVDKKNGFNHQWKVWVRGARALHIIKKQSHFKWWQKAPISWLSCRIYTINNIHTYTENASTLHKRFNGYEWVILPLRFVTFLSEVTPTTSHQNQSSNAWLKTTTGSNPLISCLPLKLPSACTWSLFTYVRVWSFADRLCCFFL